jgi:DNA-binding NarL/FixJ family response regulator
MIRVAIADDHPDIRSALRLLLSQSENVELVCEASSGWEAVKCVQQQQPDVLVMAVGMPGLDGFAAAEQIAALPMATRVILISVDEGGALAERAAAVGAQGFVAKDELAGSLLVAIESVYGGEPYFLD